MPATVSSRSPEALLSFTTNTATNLLPCCSITNKKKTLSSNSSHHHNNKKALPPINDFIATVFQRSNLTPCVCLVSLIYMQRLRAFLPRHARGELDTPYRLFLAAILVASKFLSETGTELTSQVLVAMTDYLYTPKDINLMERSFLSLIQYDLYVNLQSIQEYLDVHGKLLEMDLIIEEEAVVV
ncbi:hypothetical protein BDF20DRAFT_992930 [Mycotypha africana]|uniref:uncharacterized protein n=1 Tax=Mycotypha africana TaxID=64632 RepID=UPI00230102AB|nr:uncharacterized protein BDF20DRAFT_992930 [Mycotypha africana]KAI8992131.1 hypothetical protein BDF20DRAFT_992930 [Mycotypha africana]